MTWHITFYNEKVERHMDTARKRMKEVQENG